MAYHPIIESKKPEGKHWNDKTKAKLVKEWLKCGSLAEASKKCHVPYITANGWKKTVWWKELVEKYREELDIRLSSKIDTIVESAVDEIYNRVKDGDHILDSKTGEVLRIPPKARELAAISKFLSERQDVLIKRKKVENETNETIKDKLDSLASHFASFVKQTNVKKPDVIDGEIIECNSEGL